MRKSISFVAASMLLTASACAQNPEVPEVVKTAFSQKFPDAKKVNWDMEDASSWEAEFKLNGMEYSSNFNLKGDWLETEHEIKKSELPTSIKEILDQNFMGFKVKEAEISEKADGTVYELAVEKGEEEWELVFDMDGKLLEKKAIEEDDED
ncbi:PepSY-like domain-containing protein [Algoriphagus antarcticus]|nr:PepSY-like domain-containing protein [Algoriphagus antarcticus]